jgi:hypothetical protein
MKDVEMTLSEIPSNKIHTAEIEIEKFQVHMSVMNLNKEVGHALVTLKKTWSVSVQNRGVCHTALTTYLVSLALFIRESQAQLS